MTSEGPFRSSRDPWESEFLASLKRPWKREFESLNRSRAWEGSEGAWGRRKALPLSELRRDIVCELLLSVQKLVFFEHFNEGRLQALQEMYGTKSFEVHLYVVTKSLAESESGLNDLSDLLEAVNNSSNVEKTVLPIFYDVDPSDVRHQTGSFAEPFANYEKKYKDDPQKVERWRAALTKLGNLAGWASKNWPEAKLIREVVDEIWRKLYSSFSKPAIKNLASTPSCRQKHDVFLSFRGKDTRLNFLDHLYDALIQCRISTFRDDKDLVKGMSIRKQLEKAIEGSKVWVVIVSPNYASSKWCLDELLKILECRKASKVGKKNKSLMKPFAEYEEQAHALVNGDKTHKGKASLRNKKNISNHNKRKMGELRLGVNYGGKWVGSVYIGGSSEEIVVSEDITYSELLDKLYPIVGLHRNEDEIKISTIDESKSPAYPVEIINDDDLKAFIDQSLSSDMHLKHPLRNSSRRRTEVRVLVNYDGEWVNSTYVGGKTKGIVISDDMAHQELVDILYGIVGVDPNEYKLIMKTAYESNLPTQPVEIIDDNDLAFFTHNESHSLGMGSIFTLCTTLERRAFSNGRMGSSQSSDTAHLRRFGTCQSCVHCVTTPDQVPYLRTQVGPSSPNMPCMQQQQPPYQQQQHSYQQTTSQPFYEHYQPCFQRPKSPYQQLYPSYMQPPPPIHHVPYSLKMFWNDAARIFQDFNFWQFSFVIILLGNIFYFLSLCRNN